MKTSVVPNVPPVGVAWLKFRWSQTDAAQWPCAHLRELYANYIAVWGTGYPNMPMFHYHTTKIRNLILLSYAVMSCIVISALSRHFHVLHFH